ncbi:mitochondrial import receptor subunit OR translocase-domain-containing protein [Thelonectria olida]|uniref:Mitochondrial import receptor subunit OR translocase-domain-containing protein n=1 Tax=Thelonectria olida TaxID=1576542 RepID=A0A9P8W048_9HYPO|nr:mitochondrial import receptor subunit OR translocase-domain-containing protein [Thelonectria olida]
MFGGFAPPQQSKEEIRALEAEANFTVQGAITTAVLLYLCMWNALARHPWTPSLTHLPAPFAIELAGKVF